MYNKFSIILTALIPLTLISMPIQAMELTQAQKLVSECETSLEIENTYTEPFELSEDEQATVLGILTAETGGYGHDENGVMVDRILVAQCIRDELARGDHSIHELANGKRFSKPVFDGISEQSKLAYELVFDEGKGLVSDEINYFYNPKYGISKMHESRILVAETKYHRYFE